MTGAGPTERVRLKYRATVEMGQSPSSAAYSSSPDAGFPFLQGAADFGPASPSPGVYCNSPTKLARAGDILLSVRAPVGLLNIADRELGIGRGLCAIRPRSRWNARYGWWALHEACHQLKAASTGSTYDAVAVEDVGNLLVEPVALGAQAAIACYLDRETTRLDDLVAAKERVLALLAEKRLAVSTRAVTRGLDSRTACRSSGASWLGEIPEDWRTQRAARLFRERDERGEPDLPLFEVSIKAGVVVREFSRERIETTAADFNTYKIARRGDVVFNKMRMWQGAAGVAPQDGLVSPDYIVAAPTGALSPAYVGMLFRIGSFSAECARHSHGIVWDRLRLYWEGFREIELPVPPPEMQQQIVDYVVDATAKLDALALAMARSISLLKERRGALIAAAVNGKVELDSAA